MEVRLERKVEVGGIQADPEGSTWGHPRVVSSAWALGSSCFPHRDKSIQELHRCLKCLLAAPTAAPSELSLPQGEGFDPRGTGTIRGMQTFPKCGKQSPECAPSSAVPETGMWDQSLLQGSLWGVGSRG